MNDMLAPILASIAGGLLGLLFFGGLWWTVRRALDSPRPGLWVGGSMLLRMACVAAGFIVVSAGDWRRLLLCLLGFLAARWLVVRLTAGRAGQPPAAAPLSLAPANGRTSVDPTLAQVRARGHKPEGVVKSTGGHAR